MNRKSAKKKCKKKRITFLRVILVLVDFSKSNFRLRKVILGSARMLVFSLTCEKSNSRTDENSIILPSSVACGSDGLCQKCEISGNFLDCPETFQTLRNFPDFLKTFQTVRKLSRLSENFPDCRKTFQTVGKLSRLSRNFPDCPEYFYAIFCLDFRANCVDTRKNFPDAKKLSGRQCRHADKVFCRWA